MASGTYRRKETVPDKFLRASVKAIRLGKSSSNLFRDRKKIQAQRLDVRNFAMCCAWTLRVVMSKPRG
jgi:hypothetical protein